MENWSKNASFYHIYPLGWSGAPEKNDLRSLPVHRIEKLNNWIDHIKYLGANAVYLGPVFESSTHGYDTVDYYKIDRRLGDDETFRQTVANLRRSGIRVVLDGVFNHVGRDFWAFQDLLSHRERSSYKDWFYDIQFGRQSPYQDPFSYQGWNGHYNLVKLNLTNPSVKEHLFQAVQKWIELFDIDGLRLDAADCIDHKFMQDLATFTKSMRSEFWLMGEVVHGDYRQWAKQGELGSTTNYELYKGLYSSHNDRNYFEIAYSLNRQFGRQGIYRNLHLYTFLDNHDVNRIASNLKDPQDLVPVHILLFTVPGIPSIYYGSEFGIEGKKGIDDTPLRPELDLGFMNANNPNVLLTHLIHQLSEIRRQYPALSAGEYQELFVDHQVFAYARKYADQIVIISVNSSADRRTINVTVPQLSDRRLTNVFGQGSFLQDKDRVEITIEGKNGTIFA